MKAQRKANERCEQHEKGTMPPVTKYSKDTQELLDRMMKTSNLPLYEQRRLRAAAAAGPQAPMPPPRRRPAATHTAQVQRPYEDLLKGVPINPAMNLPGSHRKTREQILHEHGGTMERAQFRGAAPAPNRDQQKLALQQKFEFGYELPPLPAEAATVAPKAPPPRARKEEDVLRDEILSEIAERRKFLEAMHTAGKGAEHEEAIKGQIAERLRDLKTLDAL